MNLSQRSLRLHVPGAHLEADLVLPDEAQGLVVFVHGSGSSRLSTRNRQVAHALQVRGLATLLFDLLTPEEDLLYANRFDIALLTRRVLQVLAWRMQELELAELPLGLFGASTGAAAALHAAAEAGADVAAVVSRGGRPDLALAVLPQVRAPTLLIVGGNDREVLALNEQAYAALGGPRALEIVPGATHLFEEPGALEWVALLAGNWFEHYCVRR